MEYVANKPKRSQSLRRPGWLHVSVVLPSQLSCHANVCLCRYTPLKAIDGMPPALEYEPVRCKNQKCSAVLNPYW